MNSRNLMIINRARLMHITWPKFVPQTPTFSRYALGFHSAGFQNNISCSFFTLIFVFYWKIVNFNMAAIGHLGLKFPWLWNHSRFEVIQFLVNFSFSSAPSWILKNGGFDKSGLWAVSRWSSVAVCAKFGENRTNGCRSYSSFCKFQYGGRRPYWIMNLDILGQQGCSGCAVDDRYQIWCTYRTNRFP